jgi:hypothetical protein
MAGKLVTWLTLTVAALTAAIALGAFTLSYDALYAIGLAYGVKASIAWLWPLLIDLPLIVFTLAMLTAQLTRQSVKLWAGLVMLYTLATIAFNIAHAQQTALGWLVAIVAPVGLLLSTEALRHLARGTIERQAIVISLQELTQQAAHKAQEVDALAKQAGALALQVDALKADKAALNFRENTPKINTDLDTLNAARLDAKTERLNTLLAHLVANPQASLTEAAQVVSVSRQTVGAYVNELTQAGKLHRNGNGWEVGR